MRTSMSNSPSERGLTLTHAPFAIPWRLPTQIMAFTLLVRASPSLHSKYYAYVDHDYTSESIACTKSG